MNSTVATAPNPPLPLSAAAFLRLFLAVSLPLYLLDQITKYFVWRDITDPITVVPGWFDLVHVHNTGAAWGMMHNSNGFFALLSVVALGVLWVMNRYGAFAENLPRAGLFLLIPGILGNFTDRLAHGHVIDFLSFDLHVPFAHPWPSFNVADSCICIAVGVFLLSSFHDMRRKPAPAA